MRYLCLAYYDPARLAAMPPDAVQALVRQCPAKDDELRATGKLVASASLAGAQSAFAMRPRSGRAQVTDGPFTEAKEVVGGFFIVEAADRAEAERLAALHPAATLGEDAGWGLEIHPIGRLQLAGQPD
jgi:hypothetical protein